MRSNRYLLSVSASLSLQLQWLTLLGWRTCCHLVCTHPRMWLKTSPSPATKACSLWVPHIHMYTLVGFGLMKMSVSQWSNVCVKQCGQGWGQTDGCIVFMPRKKQPFTCTCWGVVTVNAEMLEQILSSAAPFWSIPSSAEEMDCWLMIREYK